MILKQIIRYTNADALEATWVRRDQMPDVEVPASPALYDKDGNEVQAAVEAHTRPGEVIETVLKCQAYSNHPEQMAMLRADLGEDAAEYEALIAEVEATYAPPAPEPLAPEQLQAMVVQATQQRLDDFARTRNYDGILSACTYADSSVPKFATEGQYAVQARDATWAACYQIMADVQAGMRAMPSVDDVLAELPALEWPQ